MSAPPRHAGSPPRAMTSPPRGAASPPRRTRGTQRLRSFSFRIVPPYPPCPPWWRVFVTALVLTLFASACGGRRENAGALTIAVIPKGTSHVFWQSIHAGAEKAARELGATIIWRGPLREDDRNSQVSEVEGFVSRGVSGIVLAPLDDSALAPPVAEAARRSIPVVIIDSGLKGE